MCLVLCHIKNCVWLHAMKKDGRLSCESIVTIGKWDPFHLELISMQKKYRNGNSEVMDQCRPKPVYSCYKCNKVGQLAKDCRMKKSESHGKMKDQRCKSEGSSQVRVTRMDDVKPDTPEPNSDNSLHYLVSSSNEEVRLVVRLVWEEGYRLGRWQHRCFSSSSNTRFGSFYMCLSDW